MAKITTLDKSYLEKLFEMHTGYVLSFTDRTFNNYFNETFNIDVTSDKYLRNGTSKANRLRAFWEIESNFLVSKVIIDFINIWQSNKDLNGLDISSAEKKLKDECCRIAAKLKDNIQVENLDALQNISNEKDLLLLIDQIKGSIEKDNPEAALDRLHTYLVKYLRVLCSRYGIIIDKNKPLNSLFGEYINKLKEKNKLKTVMSERILRTSISILDAFNSVRNDHSFAHDNPLLGYNESLLIINNISNLIKYIDFVEGATL